MYPNRSGAVFFVLVTIFLNTLPDPAHAKPPGVKWEEKIKVASGDAYQGRRLILTHLSARYSERAFVLEREAKKACSRSCELAVAYDGLKIEIPHRAADRECAR